MYRSLARYLLLLHHLSTVLAQLQVQLDFYTDLQCQIPSTSHADVSVPVSECIVTPGLGSISINPVACSSGNVQLLAYQDTSCGTQLGVLDWYRVTDTCSARFNGDIAAISLTCNQESDAGTVDPGTLVTTSTLAVGQVADSATTASQAVASNQPSTTSSEVMTSSQSMASASPSTTSSDVLTSSQSMVSSSSSTASSQVLTSSQSMTSGSSSTSSSDFVTSSKSIASSSPSVTNSGAVTTTPTASSSSSSSGNSGTTVSTGGHSTASSSSSSSGRSRSDMISIAVGLGVCIPAIGIALW
ncbi:hypothetical protein MMC12_006855 [Toensbergia leucococca]|nr:hypothetical protein [Toensbergia leucococca]